ncbi:MAG: catalase [Thiobacillus sp.]|nr:catalase [Thiobacillus sp.]
MAYCPANVVPGIDFSNDPLLQGRCPPVLTPGFRAWTA